MSAIFISHSSRDVEIAAEVRRWLASKGHRSVYLDFDPEDGTPAGRDWERELYQRLRSCRAVVALCSTYSMSSKWCFAEITQARALGKALLPVRIDDCVVDGIVADVQVIDMTADKAEAYERLWRGLLAAGVDPADTFDWDGSRAPYPGLLSFEERDAAVFFGRESEIGAALDVLNRVRRLGSAGLVLVVGASGSGKSSLVRAGLVPRLRRDTDRWLVVHPFRPRNDPIRELASALSRAFAQHGEPRERTGIYDVLGRTVGSAPAVQDDPLVVVAEDLRRLADRPEAKVLLVIDQFEELLGQPRDHPSAGLLASIGSALDSDDSPIVVLGTLRSDFLGVFQNTPSLVDLDHQLLSVGPLSAQHMAQVIEAPAVVGGLELEPGLALAMVDDMAGEDALPLLAFALRELFDRHGGDGRLDVTEYREGLGGLRGAVARVADELMESEHLGPAQEAELRLAFLAMVRLTEDDRWVRRVARWDDLPTSIHPILDRFVKARLLVSGGDAGARTLEVAHEALFSSWHRLSQWLDHSAEALRLHRDLHTAAQSWETGGHDSGDLWRGARLARAMELTDGRDLPLRPLDREFVEASQRAARAESDREERRKRRRVQVTGAVAVGALLLATVALVSFFRARAESDKARRQAEQTAAVALAAQARGVQRENPALALALAAEGVEMTDTPLPEASAALVDARIGFGDRSWQPVRVPLSDHGSRVEDVAFSPDLMMTEGDDTLMASGGRDGTVRLWDPSTGDPIGEPLEGPDVVYGVAFMSNSLLAVAGGNISGNEDNLRLWDPLTGDPVGEPLRGHDGSVLDIAFTPNGPRPVGAEFVTRLASAGEDGTVRLWDPLTGDPVGEPLRGHDGPVLQVAFSRDGTRLASAGADGTVRLWDPSTGERIGGGPPHLTAVGGLAFGFDGILASGSNEGLVHLSGMTPTGEPFEETFITESGVSELAFLPQAGLFATAGSDGTVRLWSSTNGDPIGVPVTDHDGPIHALAFSPDGTKAASGGADGTVRLWDPTEGDPVFRYPLSGHEDQVSAVAFSPDGQRLASSSSDETVRLWNNPTSERGPLRSLEETLAGHDGDVSAVAFSPDGTLLASAGREPDAEAGIVRLWDVVTGDPVGQPITIPNNPVTAVAFTSDSARLAFVDSHRRLRLWDINTRDPVGRAMSDHNGVVRALAISPDGNLLASTGDDGTIRLWDPETGRPAGETLRSHEGSLYAVSFSPDGNMLASAGDDGKVRLWDINTGEPVGQALTGHDGVVRGLAFSPDGTVLASGGQDGTIRLWDTATGTPLGEPLTDHAGDVFTVAFNPDRAQLASAGADTTVRLWEPLWDVDQACDLAAPYLTAAQVEPYLPPGREPTACDLN